MTRFDRFLSLGAALIAVVVLLAVYPAHRTTPPTDPVPAASAWPRAQIATIDANLGDGMPYQPMIFLDSQTSVGTAPDPDHQSIRLVMRGRDGSLRQLRSLPPDSTPWFGGFTVAGDVVAWAEGSASEHLQIWAVNLRDGLPARQVTADTGDADFSGSQYDLQIANGLLHWASSTLGTPEVTEIRSVPLTGGTVDIRTEPGSWQLSAWPWLVNGLGDPRGTTTVRNLSTNLNIAIRNPNRSTARCSPTWCDVISPSAAGVQIEVMHPDGTARDVVADGAAVTAIPNVALLDRFEVLSQLGPYSALTNTRQILIFDLATRRTIEVSSAARTVSAGGGVLWWSTGAADAPVWHSLDLRTV
jgi:hypothetical protein